VELPERQPQTRNDNEAPIVSANTQTNEVQESATRRDGLEETPATLQARRIDPSKEKKKPSEDRVSVLSDGIFAIATTLLVLSIQIPLSTDSENVGTFNYILKTSFLSETISYLITFTVLAFYWINHRDLMNGLKRIDHPFILLNLLFLAFVAFFPVTANLLHYDQFPMAVVIYTAILAGCGYSSLLLWIYAASKDFLDPNETAFGIRAADLLGAATTPTYFLLSLLALLIPGFKPGNLFYLWIALPVIAIVARRLEIFQRRSAFVQSSEPHEASDVQRNEIVENEPNDF
jgi:uncharacterized membrane protein